MRLMSFAYTPDQLLDGSKTVTRRVGWANLKAGERYVGSKYVPARRKMTPADVVTRIEFRKVLGSERGSPTQTRTAV